MSFGIPGVPSAAAAAATQSPPSANIDPTLARSIRDMAQWATRDPSDTAQRLNTVLASSVQVGSDLAAGIASHLDDRALNDLARSPAGANLLVALESAMSAGNVHGPRSAQIDRIAAARHSAGGASGEPSQIVRSAGWRGSTEPVNVSSGPLQHAWDFVSGGIEHSLNPWVPAAYSRSQDVATSASNAPRQRPDWLPAGHDPYTDALCGLLDMGAAVAGRPVAANVDGHPQVRFGGVDIHASFDRYIKGKLEGDYQSSPIAPIEGMVTSLRNSDYRGAGAHTANLAAQFVGYASAIRGLAGAPEVAETPPPRPQARVLRAIGPGEGTTTTEMRYWRDTPTQSTNPLAGRAPGTREVTDIAVARAKAESCVAGAEGGESSQLPERAGQGMVHSSEHTFYRIEGSRYVRPTPSEEALFRRSVKERREFSVSDFFDGRRPVKYEGDRVSCRVEGGPEVSRTLHTHPTTKVAMPSGADVELFAGRGRYDPTAVHEIVGDKWPQTRSTLADMGLEPPPLDAIKWQATTEQVCRSAEPVEITRPSGT